MLPPSQTEERKSSVGLLRQASRDGRVYIQALGSNETQHVQTSDDKLWDGLATASEQWTRNTEVV